MFVLFWIALCLVAHDGVFIAALVFRVLVTWLLLGLLRKQMRNVLELSSGLLILVLASNPQKCACLCFQSEEIIPTQSQ